MKKLLKILTISTLAHFHISTFSQSLLSSGSITGNLQFDFKYYQPDPSIDFDPAEKMGINTWADFIYQSGAITAGIRYELFQNPFDAGFPPAMEGQGFPHKFISYKKGDLSVTLGSYYAQFGNGLLLRTYQDKGLGIDNALNGVKLEYMFLDKIYLTALSGKERYYWQDLDESIIRAADMEVYLSDFIKENGAVFWKSGASYVNRYYPPGDNPVSLFPAYVEAYSFRNLLRYKRLTVEGEYAWKTSDPLPIINDMNEAMGTAWYINASYHTKGLGPG